MVIDAVPRVCFGDLSFEQVPVQAYSSQGTPYVRSVPIGMPKIPDMMLDNVFYLYKTEEDAKVGRAFGGTGFLLAVRTEIIPDRGACIYAITNWHVAVRDGYSAVRLNTIDGQSDIFPFEPHEWAFDPRYDIAVRSIPLDFGKHKLSVAHIEDIISEEYLTRFDIGLGDDVFMIGRFVDHDGGQTNRPTARFGHISLMPSPIKQPNHKWADSYCIDLHSRTGYSGSPVFVYRTPTGNLNLLRDNAAKHPVAGLGPAFLGLLGIHWGQFPEFWRIEDGRVVAQDEAEDHGTLIREGQYVKGLSGMGCVLPATYIAEVLNMPELRQDRVRAEREWLKTLRESGTLPPEAESATNPEENPTHREDFNRLVGAASKSKPKVGRT